MPSARLCLMRFCNVFRENFTVAIDKRRIVSYTDKKSGETVMIASRRFFAYIYYFYFRNEVRAIGVANYSKASEFSL